MISSNMVQHWGVSAIAILLSAAALGATQQCSRRSVLSMEIASHRNLSGHWITSVTLANDGTRSSMPFKHRRQIALNMDQETLTCGSNETVLLTATAKVSRSLLPDGYEFINGQGFYKFHSAPLTWVNARGKCIQEGAHLIVINSAAEADVIRTFFERKPIINNATNSEDIHVGFHDRYVEGQYTTVLGYPLKDTGYTKWAPNQPDNTPSDNCGACLTGGVLLHDIPCSWSLAFICEALL